jgi:hypothetical protein
MRIRRRRQASFGTPFAEAQQICEAGAQLLGGSFGWFHDGAHAYILLRLDALSVCRMRHRHG